MDKWKDKLKTTARPSHTIQLPPGFFTFDSCFCKRYFFSCHYILSFLHLRAWQFMIGKSIRFRNTRYAPD